MAHMARCKEKDCFANSKGGCRCLSDNNFGGRHCPFRRTDITWEDQVYDCEEYAGKKKGGSK